MSQRDGSQIKNQNETGGRKIRGWAIVHLRENTELRNSKDKEQWNNKDIEAFWQYN